MRGIVTIDRRPGSEILAVWVSARASVGHREQYLGEEANDPANGGDTRPENVNAVVINMKTDAQAMEKVRSLVSHSVVVATDGSDLTGLPIDSKPMSVADFGMLTDETEEHQRQILEALDSYATRISPKTGAVLRPRPVARPNWVRRPAIDQFRPGEDTPAARALATANYVCALWRYWLATDEERRARVDSPPRMTDQLSSPIVPDFPPKLAARINRREQSRPAGSETVEITEEFSRALECLNSGSHLFLTGRAGTGKSTLIRHYLQTTDRSVVVAAPTGIAALNVDGYTLHRLFSFSTTTTIEDVLGDTGYYPGRFSKAIKAMHTLIIDEASMVRADLFDMVEAALRRFGPHPGESFGGVQVVLVGDLLQLPPVVVEAEQTFFSSRYETPFFFSADTFDRANFPTVALTKVFRQLGDHRLTSVLNAVREGVLVAEASKELATRVMPDFEPPEDEFWLTLGATNAIVASRNSRQLERLPAVAHTSMAIQQGDLSLFDLSSMEEALRYKVGAQVMMLTNDPANRWVNGTIGRIVATDDTEQPLVTTEFRDHTRAEVGLHTWDVTRPTAEGGSLRHEVVGTFTQLPFKLAWAITIHKSQGQTLDNLVVDLAGGAFASGQVYVALSRCTSMDGLVLKQAVRPKDLKTDRRALRFMQAATAPRTGARFCAVATLSVGSVGRMWRPRPVEIAVAFEDGTALSTLLNPGQDLFNARDDFDITVADILLAPSLPEAWSILGPVLEGWTPVGVNIDTTWDEIDYELKRHATTVALPSGVSIPTDALTERERQLSLGRTALERANAALAAFKRQDIEDPGAGPFEEASELEASASFLLTRDPGTPVPLPPQLPALAGLTQVSRELSAVILNGCPAAAIKQPGDDLDELRRMVGQGLTDKVQGYLPLPSTIAAQLPELDRLLSTSLTHANRNAIVAKPSIEEALRPGTRFYITGTPHTCSGERIEKTAVAALAAKRGLEYAESFRKKSCDVLVLAEEGSQSGKAKKAAGWSMPTFCLDEFWSWLDA